MYGEYQMTVNTLQELMDAVNNGQVFRRVISKSSQNLDTLGTPEALWTVAGMPGAGVAPATKEAPTRATTGAIHFPTPTNNSFLLRFGMDMDQPNQGLMLVDVLSWSAGLSGTVSTEQTTNLPTTALTRYTNGENVWLGLICWTATGSTAVNVTAKYTNQAGTANRNTTSVNFWGGGLGAVSGAPTAVQVQWLPLQSGDYGVRSVESVTLSASTLTAGNFGVMLCKPLAYQNQITLRSQQELDQILQTSALPEIIDDACLMAIVGLASSSASITSSYVDILQV